MRFSLLVFLTLAVTAFGQKTPPLSPKLVLADQFGQAADLSETKGDVVVLVYGDKKSVDANRVLGAALHVQFHPTARGQSSEKAQKAPVKPVPNWPAGVRAPDVRVTAIACIGKVPGLVAKLIRGHIRRHSPVLPVYLDFADTMKRAFGVAPKISNVVVLDTKRRVRYRAAARYSREQMMYLVNLIDQLRLEARSANK